MHLDIVVHNTFIAAIEGEAGRDVTLGLSTALTPVIVVVVVVRVASVGGAADGLKPRGFVAGLLLG